jgi:hypothetical protein
MGGTDGNNLIKCFFDESHRDYPEKKRKLIVYMSDPPRVHLTALGRSMSKKHFLIEKQSSSSYHEVVAKIIW